MDTVRIDTLRHGPVGMDVAQTRASLWILPQGSPYDLAALVKLHWANVWNFNDSIDFETIWRNSNHRRLPFVVSNAEDDVESLDSNAYVRIYQLSTAGDLPKLSATLRRLRKDQLRLRASQTGGTVFVTGDIAAGVDEIELLSELAPQLRICLLDFSGSPSSSLGVGSAIYRWSADPARFVDEFSGQTAAFAHSTTLALKDAPPVQVSAELLEQLGADWTLLTANRIAPTEIDQDKFDNFLNGEPEWTIFASEGAYLRKLRRRPSDSVDKDAQEVNFSDDLFAVLRQLDQQEVDPRDALRQMIIFAEPGSGTTTFLRQLAVLTAKAGYPTLLTSPVPRNLNAGTLGRFIGAVQDLWWEHRRGPGRGTGRLPVVLFLDKDAEGVADGKVLAKALSTVGREILLVRALERSRDEMAEARGVYLMSSEVDEAELLALGGHLRHFCEKFSLAPVPKDAEWRAYHQGLSQVSRYSVVTRGGAEEEVPHLFLIGIYPFLVERISDVNSLEQYYFQRWDAIISDNIKSIIHVVCSAGVFGLSVPYNALRRHASLDLAELEKASNETHRRIETFLEWRRRGTNLQGWYLRVRHPLVGRLLCRAIDPIEGHVPFRPLAGILTELTTKEDDLWFAETLAFRIGQNFKPKGPGFSLETDTPLQKAARTIFDSIPKLLKDVSRTIAHHEARYHLHVIHACLAALKDPNSTTLTPEQVREALRVEAEHSAVWLEHALGVRRLGEPDSNILNTYARLKFAQAQGIGSSESKEATDVFQEGLDLQERAIEGDVTNGHALYQFVQQILEAASDKSRGLSATQQLDLLARSEARLAELIRLHREGRWRNMDPVDAEVQLGTLLASHTETISQIPSIRELLAEFEVKHPEAALRLRIRLQIGARSYEEGFRNASIANVLRDLRSQLFELPDKSPRGLLYLYRLFLADPLGRNEFRMRFDILSDLKRKSTEQFLPYWHDEAALLCQLDNIPAGAERFAELRAFRKAQEAQWFWLNERILLQANGRVRLRPLTLVAADPMEGWAQIQNTRVRMKYQPQQFRQMSRNSVFRGYVRFTIYGLQAVSEEFALRDFEQLGLS